MALLNTAATAAISSIVANTPIYTAAYTRWRRFCDGKPQAGVIIRNLNDGQPDELVKGVFIETLKKRLAVADRHNIVFHINPFTSGQTLQAERSLDESANSVWTVAFDQRHR